MLYSASLSLLSTKSWYLSLDSLNGRGFDIWYRLSSLLSCAAYASGTHTEFTRQDATARLLNVVLTIRFRAPQILWWDDSTVALWKKRSQYSRDTSFGIMISRWSCVSTGRRCIQRIDFCPLHFPPLPPPIPGSIGSSQRGGQTTQVKLKNKEREQSNSKSIRSSGLNLEVGSSSGCLLRTYTIEDVRTIIVPDNYCRNNCWSLPNHGKHSNQLQVIASKVVAIHISFPTNWAK